MCDTSTVSDGAPLNAISNSPLASAPNSMPCALTFILARDSGCLVFASITFPLKEDCAQAIVGMSSDKKIRMLIFTVRFLFQIGRRSFLNTITFSFV